MTSVRPGSMPLTLILVVIIAGPTDAVTLVSTVDGGKYRFDNATVATDHSCVLKTFYGQQDPEEREELFAVPISSTEIQLIVEFVNKTAGQHVDEAYECIRRRIEAAELDELCRLLTAFHYLDMGALVGAISIALIRRGSIIALRGTLSDDVIVFLLVNTPGLRRLDDVACTCQQNAIFNEIHHLMLFSGKADLTNDAPWTGDLTVLQWAAGAGETTVVELLANIPGVDVNVFYRTLTPLELLVYSSNAGIIEMLGNPAGIIVEKKVQTPLIIAAEVGHTESVEALLKYAAGRLHANARDGVKMTALHWAARYGHSRIVELLLGYEGIEVNAGNRKGQTPLHMAAAFGHVEVVALLLNFQSVNVNQRDDLGRYTGLGQQSEA